MADYEENEDRQESEPGESPEDELIEEARERFKSALEAETNQRDREAEDLSFQIPERQWRDEDRRQRQGDGKSIAARPTLSISLLDQPRQLILNQMRQADLGINIQPISEDADEDTADAIQGLYRHIERKSRAELVRLWAFDRATACGRGWYRVLTAYDEEGGDPSDQKIVIQRILRQEGVYSDPAAQEPDFSDGEFVFVCAWMEEDEFERRYPKAKKTPANSSWLEGLREAAPDWVDADDVLVAEYWYKEHKTTKFKAGKEERERDEVTVYKAIINGWELLEKPVKWPGRHIPLIPVIGREIVPFDEERRWVGMIGPAKDGQRFYNFAASSFVERIAMEPKAPWVGPAQSFEGYEEYYKQANVRNLPFLPYNIGNAQNPLPAPQRAQIDLSGASLAAQGMQMAQGFVQSATAVFDPSLGRLPDKDRSGKAIMALQSQADAGTGHFLANLADISMTYEAKVILDLIPKIYDRPGRITRILKGDQRKAEPIMLNAPFTMNKGRPMRYVPPAPPRPMPAPMPQPGMPPQGMMPPGPQGMPPQAPPQQPPRPAPLPDGVKEYNLKEGVYGVAVNVGKSFQTRRQEGFEKMSEFLGNEPQLFVALGDLMLKYADWPGSDDMAKRMVKMRDNQMPFLRDDAEGGPGPDQLKSQLTQMGQQMQMQGQALQQAMQVLQSKQAEQAAKIEVAQINANALLQGKQMDNETKLALAGMEAKFMGQLEQVKLLIQHSHEQRNQLSDQFHEAASQARDQAHEVAMQQLNQAGPEPPQPPEPAQDGGNQ